MRPGHYAPVALLPWASGLLYGSRARTYADQDRSGDAVQLCVMLDQLVQIGWTKSYDSAVDNETIVAEQAEHPRHCTCVLMQPGRWLEAWQAANFIACITAPKAAGGQGHCPIHAQPVD